MSKGLKQVALESWFTSTYNKVIGKGVTEVTLSPKGKIKEIELRVWCNEKGFAIMSLGEGRFRIGKRHTNDKAA